MTYNGKKTPPKQQLPEQSPQTAQQQQQQQQEQRHSSLPVSTLSSQNHQGNQVQRVLAIRNDSRRLKDQDDDTINRLSLQPPQRHSVVRAAAAAAASGAHAVHHPIRTPNSSEKDTALKGEVVVFGEGTGYTRTSDLTLPTERGESGEHPESGPSTISQPPPMPQQNKLSTSNTVPGASAITPNSYDSRPSDAKRRDFHPTTNVARHPVSITNDDRMVKGDVVAFGREDNGYIRTSDLTLHSQRAGDGGNHHPEAGPTTTSQPPLEQEQSISTPPIQQPGAYSESELPPGGVPRWYRRSNETSNNGASSSSNRNSRNRRRSSVARSQRRRQQRSRVPPEVRTNHLGSSFSNANGSSSLRGSTNSSSASMGLYRRISRMFFAGDASVTAFNENNQELQGQEGIEEQYSRNEPHEENESGFKNSGFFFTKKEVCCVITSVVIIVAISVGIYIGVTNSDGNDGVENQFHQNSGSDDEDLTHLGTDESVLTIETDRVKLIRDILKLKLYQDDDGSFEPPSDNEYYSNLLQDTSTPQYQAMKWLADEDEAQIELLMGSSEYSTKQRRRLLTRYSLATIYYATTTASSSGGHDWKDDFGFLSSKHECNWTSSNVTTINDDDIDEPPSFLFRPGVSCDMDEQVTSLNLANNSLFGFIPEEIKVLSNLQHLTVSYNTHYELDQQEQQPNLDAIESFNNIIRSFGSGNAGNHNLTYLDISNNGWDMTIPSNIWRLSNLEKLHLENNQLKHFIPNEISQLSNLKRLYLNEDVNLRGDIDTIVANMSSLEVLDTRGCQELTISNQFSFPISLASLQLQLNRFREPTTLSLSNVGKLSDLHTLDISYMYFLEGNVPSEVLAAMTNLEVLNLAGNGFTREFPWSSLIFGENDSEESVIRKLELGGRPPNRFQGELPSVIGRLTSLESLHVGHNRFSGRIPSEMSNLSSLAELFLHSNDFTGGDIGFLCDNIDRLGGIGRGTISTDQNITCRCCLTWD